MAVYVDESGEICMYHIVVNADILHECQCICR